MIVEVTNSHRQLEEQCNNGHSEYKIIIKNFTKINSLWTVWILVRRNWFNHRPLLLFDKRNKCFLVAWTIVSTENTVLDAKDYKINHISKLKTLTDRLSAMQLPRNVRTGLDSLSHQYQPHSHSSHETIRQKNAMLLLNLCKPDTTEPEIK
jgi:hypothetical protein